MSTQEITQTLVSEIKEVLDLDDFESRVYLRLLKIGPVTGSALAKDLDSDRAGMYRTLERLAEKKIVLITLSNPKLCSAMPPHKALQFALTKKEKEVKKIKKSRKSIISKINKEFSGLRPQKIPTLRIVQGRPNIYSDIAQLIENSEDTVFIATTISDVSEMVKSRIPEKIKISREKGGKVFLLINGDVSEIPSFVSEMNTTQTRICNLPSKGRMAVHKDHHMVMSESNPVFSNPETDFSISTNAVDMVNSVDKLCQMLWESAKNN